MQTIFSSASLQQKSRNYKLGCNLDVVLHARHVTQYVIISSDRKLSTTPFECIPTIHFRINPKKT